MKGLLKATLQSGAASAGNLLAAMASAKIYAVVLGPEYNAVAGVINNLVAFCVALATAAGTAAFLQGASSRSGQERWQFIKTVVRLYRDMERRTFKASSPDVRALSRLLSPSAK